MLTEKAVQAAKAAEKPKCSQDETFVPVVLAIDDRNRINLDQIVRG